MAFPSEPHGQVGCITCHKGVNSADAEKAHAGMVRDPSDDESAGVCAVCHVRISDRYADSLHYTLRGYKTALANRSSAADVQYGKPLDELFKNACSKKCHTTCGQCHVSRPAPAKNGLYERHTFTKKPPMDKACYGCHGARNAGDYLGNVSGTADIHLKKKKMDCTACHSEENFHGSGRIQKNMYDTAGDLPRCETCHKKVLGKKSKIVAHRAHKENEIACAVCHGVRNDSCYGCHVSVDAAGASKSSSEIVPAFKIGLNPIPSKDRPYKYVALRHVPTVKDSFDAYGTGLLSRYDAVPTWKYSPLHNIRRITPQNEKCNACHGVKKLFLTADDLRAGDSEANKTVVVPKIPKLIDKNKKY
ncbi:MAG: hypothetical protein WA148_00100 [Actinomycetota bacterium]